MACSISCFGMGTGQSQHEARLVSSFVGWQAKGHGSRYVWTKAKPTTCTRIIGRHSREAQPFDSSTHTMWHMQTRVHRAWAEFACFLSRLHVGRIARTTRVRTIIADLAVGQIMWPSFHVHRRVASSEAESACDCRLGSILLARRRWEDPWVWNASRPMIAS